MTKKAKKNTKKVSGNEFSAIASNYMEFFNSELNLNIEIQVNPDKVPTRKQ